MFQKMMLVDETERQPAISPERNDPTIEMR